MKLILTILMYLVVTSTSSIAGFRTGDGDSSGSGNGFSIKASNSNFYDNYSDEPASDPTIKDTSNKAIKPAQKSSSVVKKSDAPVQKKPSTTTKKVQKVIAEDGSVSYSWASLQQTKTPSAKETVKLLAVATDPASNSIQGFNGRKTQLKQSQWVSKFTMFPQDENGWSVIKPQVDSRIIYVSSSDGDDSKAKAYVSKDIGNPFKPSKKIVAFKTIEKAVKLLRNGYPDWLLLRRGDKWNIKKALYIPSGRASKEPIVITSYGISEARPQINTGIGDGIRLHKVRGFIAMIGIELYANQRNPESNNFVGWSNVGAPVGFSSVTNDIKEVQSIYLEDNIFRFFSLAIGFQGGANHKNIILRRNQILDSYSANSHSSGIYVNNTSMLLEENLLDHNGWYQKSYEVLNNQSKGQATFFNHNAYLESLFESVITGNIFSRASSMGIKLTSNSIPGKLNSINAWGIVIKNNLFLEGEIGISAGGNTDNNNGYRWKDISIIDNVMMHIGNAQPTKRDLAWHIDVQDWDGGTVTNNYLLYNDNNKVGNVYGIKVSGFTRNVTVANNVVRGIGAKKERIIFQVDNEKIQNVNINANNISIDKELKGQRKDLATYFNMTSEDNGIKNLIMKAKSQSKEKWNKTYTAGAINNYIKNN